MPGPQGQDLQTLRLGQGQGQGLTALVLVHVEKQVQPLIVWKTSNGQRRES